MNLAELRARLEAIQTERRALHEAAGDAALGEEAQSRWEALDSEEATLRENIRTAEEAEARAARVAESRARWGSTSVGNTTPDAYEVLNRAHTATGRELRDANLRALEDRGVEPENMEHVRAVLTRHLDNGLGEAIGGETRDWAANLLARTRPEYVRAFAKLMVGRGDLLTAEERTAMSAGSNTNGGYLIPTHLDPTIILTNSGSSNVIRGLSRVVTLTEGTTWNGVTSAGVTASWDGELAEVSDDTPTFARVSIATNVAQSFVQASIAAFEDIAGLQSDVLMMFADARDRLEGAAHATGLGTSNQPKGIVTALDASTAVEITSTTAAAIGEVDIHAVYRAVPVRYRGRGTWLMNPLYALAVKRLGTAVSSSYSGDLTMPVSDRILGRPQVESDDMPTTQTTTALDNEIVFGDFSQYVIVDKPGSMSVEFIPHLFNTNANLPDGRRGWFAYWRTGADATNILAFRLLQDKTSA